jgi:2'-5' RNA ligase
MSVLAPFDTGEITLYRSYSGRSGSRYEKLEVFALG